MKFIVPPAKDSNEQAGLWNYQWYDSNSHSYTCHAYPNSDKSNGIDIKIDAYWMAARGFSCLTLIFGGLILVVNTFLLMYRLCYEQRPRDDESSIVTASGRIYFTTTSGQYIKKQVGGTLYLLAFICSTFSLLFLRSNACLHNTIFNLTNNHQCVLSTGVHLTYTAMILYFIAASILLLNDESDSGSEERDAVGDYANNNTAISEPLIQDVVFECEQPNFNPNISTVTWVGAGDEVEGGAELT